MNKEMNKSNYKTKNLYLINKINNKIQYNNNYIW